MAKKKILFISQEIMPYLPESEMAHIGRYLPQGIQEKGKEIRTFMPASRSDSPVGNEFDHQ